MKRLLSIKKKDIVDGWMCDERAYSKKNNYRKVYLRVLMERKWWSNRRSNRINKHQTKQRKKEKWLQLFVCPLPVIFQTKITKRVTIHRRTQPSWSVSLHLEVFNKPNEHASQHQLPSDSNSSTANDNNNVEKKTSLEFLSFVVICLLIFDH